MWTKPYGNTGKDISVLSMGGMRFPNHKDIDASAELVLHAHARGVNYFDTAPFYQDDMSEDIYGAAIKQMPPGSFYISTKCGKPTAAELRESLERSLKRLGVEQINFFHIWCVVTWEEWLERKKGGAVAEAVKAKEEGLIEHLVVSSHLPGDRLGDMLDDGPFEGVTVGYSAINFPYRQSGVQHAEQRGLGVVTMNPLGGGLIPQNAERFDFLRGPDDPSVLAAALRFNISQPSITSALVGFDTMEHIDSAVDAVEDFTPYPPSHIEAVREKILDEFDGLCTGCGYCLPCPAEVNIPSLMDACNHAILRDDDDKHILSRLQWHWFVKPDVAEACTHCGACEKKCTQHLPIRDRIKRIAALVEDES